MKGKGEGSESSAEGLGSVSHLPPELPINRYLDSDSSIHVIQSFDIPKGFESLVDQMFETFDQKLVIDHIDRCDLLYLVNLIIFYSLIDC